MVVLKVFAVRAKDLPVQLRSGTRYRGRRDYLCYNTPMPRQSAAVLKSLMKWFFIPVGLAALGFFVIGPRIGNVEGLERPVLASPESEEENSGDPEPISNGVGGPDVEVSSKPLRRVAPVRTVEITPKPELPPDGEELPPLDPPPGDDPPNEPPPADPPPDSATGDDGQRIE